MLVSEYQVHAKDIVGFVCINPNKETTDEILKKTFILVFRSIKGGKNFLPFHLFIYSKIIDAAKKTKQTPGTYSINVKDLSTDVCVEDFNPADLPKETDIFTVLNKISPEDRALLCLSIRHKINNEELASLFRTSKGTIVSKIIRIKTTLAKALIEANQIAPNKPVKQQDGKECFFIKNNVSEKNKIEKHISKCVACKNFYNWQLKIDELFLSKPRPTVSSSINKDIFEHLDLFSIDRRIMYNIRTKLVARVAFIFVVLSVFLLAGLWVKKQIEPHKNPIQEIKISDKVVQKNEEIKYMLSTNALKNWKDVNKKIKETIIDYGQPSDSVNEKGMLYTIILEKTQAVKLVQQIQSQANFDVKTPVDQAPLDNKNNIRVEIQVNKNGI